MWKSVLHAQKSVLRKSVFLKSMKCVNRTSYLCFDPFKRNVNFTRHKNRFTVSFYATKANLSDFNKRQDSDSKVLQLEKLTFPEKLVNKSPLGLQPFLKLMRIDKPTGEYLNVIRKKFSWFEV